MSNFNIYILAKYPELARRNSPLDPCKININLMFEKSFLDQIQASNERRAQRKKEARQRYCLRNKRVSFTVPNDEFKKLKKRADQNGRLVGQQAYEESKAYHRAEFLPSKEIQISIHLLLIELKRIGVNINQIAFHTNYFNRIMHQKDLVTEFNQLFLMLESFVKKPWTVKKVKNKIQK